MQTCCVAPNTQSIGRRVVGSVAGAAFLTWALQSASAKSMKPGEVEKRSKEEENAVFENRQGEVTSHQPGMPSHQPWIAAKTDCLLQVHRTDAEWKSMLSSGQYRVLRQSSTELPLSSPLDHASDTHTAYAICCISALSAA